MSEMSLTDYNSTSCFASSRHIDQRLNVQVAHILYYITRGGWIKLLLYRVGVGKLFVMYEDKI